MKLLLMDNRDIHMKMYSISSYIIILSRLLKGQNTFDNQQRLARKTRDSTLSNGGAI